MTIIANLELELFYTHALETYLIGGLIIFFIGFLLGYYLWRRARIHTEQVQEMNRILSERHSALSANQKRLAALVDELPENPSV